MPEAFFRPPSISANFGDGYGTRSFCNVGIAGQATQAPPPPPNPSGTPTVADWCARGTSWLLAQFADKPIIRDLLCSILGEVDALEQAVADVREIHRDVDQAFGTSLDQLGRLLGWRRQDNVTDTIYRAELKAVAAVRVDNSSLEAVIRVFTDLLSNGHEVLDDYPATYRVFSDDPLTYVQGEHASRIGRLAKPTAVRYDLNYVPFGFDIMSFSDDTAHPAVPFAERGSDTNIRMAERNSGR